MAENVRDTINYGFKVGVEEPIDDRLVLTKIEMEKISNEYETWGVPMPDVYLAVCSDDGKIYEYDRSRASGEEPADVGKFRPVDSIFDVKVKSKDSSGIVDEKSVVIDKVAHVDLTELERRDNLYKNPDSGKILAETGDYRDLSNKPTIGDGKLTFKPSDDLGPGYKYSEYIGKIDDEQIVMNFTANTTDSKAWPFSVVTKTSNLINDGEDGTGHFIESKEMAREYSIIKETGYIIKFVQDITDPREYRLRAELYSAAHDPATGEILLDTFGNPIEDKLLSSTSEIDIPLEEAVKSVSFSDDNKKFIITKISGAIFELDLQNVVDSFDLTTNEFVNEQILEVKDLVSEVREFVSTNREEVEEELKHIWEEDETGSPVGGSIKSYVDSLDIDISEELDKKQNVLVGKNPIYLDDDPFDLDKSDIGLKIDSKALDINSDGELTTKLFGHHGVKVEEGAATTEITAVVDNLTILSELGTGELYVPIDNKTIKSEDGKVFVSLDENGTVYYDDASGQIRGEGAITNVEEIGGNSIGALALVNNPDTGLYGNYKKVFGVKVDDTTIKIEGGKLVAQSGKLSDVTVKFTNSEGYVSVVDFNPASPTYTQALLDLTPYQKNITPRTNIWYDNSDPENIYLDAIDFESGDGIELDKVGHKMRITATGVVSYYSSLHGKPQLSLGAEGPVELDGIIDLSESLNLYPDSVYNPESTHFTSGVAVAQAISGLRTSLDGDALADDGFALTGVREVDGVISKFGQIRIPTVNNNELDIKVNGVSKAKFTANSNVDVVASIDVPVRTSDLVNDGETFGGANPFSKHSETGNSVDLKLTGSNLSVDLFNLNNDVISSDTIYLPLSNMFVAANLNLASKKITFSKYSSTATETIDLSTLLSVYEILSNKVNSTGVISPVSTDDQYPSCKLVYNTLLDYQKKLPNEPSDWNSVDYYLHINKADKNLEWETVESRFIATTSSTLPELYNSYLSDKTLFLNVNGELIPLNTPDGGSTFIGVYKSGKDSTKPFTETTYTLNSSGWNTVENRELMDYVDWDHDSATDSNKVLTIRSNSATGKWDTQWSYPTLRNATAILMGGDWTLSAEGYYTQEVVVSDMNNSSRPMITLSLSKEDFIYNRIEILKDAWTHVFRAESDSNKVKFYSTENIDYTLTVQLAGF